jgi:hypothetical protein
VAVIHGRPRVFINGQDVSDCVREVVIRSAVDEVTTATLELVARPRIDADGSLHLDSYLTPPAEQAIPARAMRVREDQP